MDVTPKFKTNYILIDYENVQPKNLELLVIDNFKIYIFVGAKQQKISIDLAKTLQSFGPNGHYIQVTGTRPDALDFHIAYYIGELRANDEEAWFRIISKDKGFDPLVNHLQERRLKVVRHDFITDIPFLQVSNKASSNEKVDAVVKNLAGRGHSKPRKEKTLANTINSIFKKPLPEAEMAKLIAQLKSKKFIKTSAGNVTYNLPRLDQ